MALKFFDELRRKVYITPKSYLDSIKFFTESVEEKRKETRNNLNTLASGLKKLRATEIQVAELKEILIQLQPELQEQNKKAQEALERNKEEAKIAGAEEREVEKETARVEQQGIQIKYVRDDAQQELDKAMPELEAAQEGLKNLKKEDITMLKSYINPPKCVALTMQAVLILLEHTDTTWKEAMRVLSDIKFLEKLKEYNADDIKVSVLKKLGGVIHLKEFDPDDIYDKCRPAKSLACWAIAVSKYSEALKKVIPKKQKLLIYEEKFQVAHQELMKKQKELEKMKAILAQYEAEYAKMMENIAALTDKIEATSKRHQNAEKLIELLADEGIRWNQQMGILTSEEKELVGNVFLSAISICYIGPFNGSYRDALIQEWRNQCTNQNILTSENYSLIHTIGNAVTIKNWNICGLPTDIVSTENGIIATKSMNYQLSHSDFSKTMASDDRSPRTGE
jgi:dynein heavy chain, axonemal